MESITGYVDHIVFQNSENGYTVMILMMEGEEVTCVGMCKGLGQGENITAEASGRSTARIVHSPQRRRLSKRLRKPFAVSVTSVPR